MTEQHDDQPVDFLAPISVSEHVLHRCGETRRVAHCLGAGRERRLPEFGIRPEAGEIEQAAPHEPSRMGRVQLNSAYCASTDQRSCCRRSSTSFTIAAVTATMIELAKRFASNA